MQTYWCYEDETDWKDEILQSGEEEEISVGVPISRWTPKRNEDQQHVGQHRNTTDHSCNRVVVHHPFLKSPFCNKIQIPWCWSSEDVRLLKQRDERKLEGRKILWRYVLSEAVKKHQSNRQRDWTRQHNLYFNNRAENKRDTSVSIRQNIYYAYII